RPAAAESASRAGASSGPVGLPGLAPVPVGFAAGAFVAGLASPFGADGSGERAAGVGFGGSGRFASGFGSGLGSGLGSGSFSGLVTGGPAFAASASFGSCFW